MRRSTPRRHVVLPGLVNTHHHFFQTLTRAHPAAINQELFPWLKSLYPIWARLKPDDLRLAARLALVELLLSGCTTAADHHYLYPPGLEDAVDIEVEEARALGMRMTVTRGSMNLSAEGRRPAARRRRAGRGDDPRRQRARAEAVPRSQARRAYPHRARAVLAVLDRQAADESRPRSSPSATIASCTRISARPHDEERFCLDMYGHAPGRSARRDRLDVEADVARARHSFQRRRDCAARRGRASASAIARPPTWCSPPASAAPASSRRAGAPVGLGVDGSASNDSSNMMEAVRHALMIGRLRYGACAVTHLDVLRWATEGSARCLGRDDIGRIAPAWQADLALFTLDEPRFSGAHDPLAALVLCGAHRADRVMIAGAWRVDRRRPGRTRSRGTARRTSRRGARFRVRRGVERRRFNP